MSIKLLALDLYKAQQNVERLRTEMEGASPEDQVVLKRELADARKEWEVLRKMLDGRKDSGSFRQKFAGFGS
jgi:5-bromo-4-chloroindolyl phosphate hydrolysis protein